MWIFLDIDGVLVPEKKFEISQQVGDLLQFNRECLEAFEIVLRKFPDVLVVISSSWREVFPFSSIRPLFSPDIASRVVGFTPFLDPVVLHNFQYLRYQEVLEFLRLNHALHDPWVAIDDITEHYPPEVNLVVTNADEGFDSFAAEMLELYLFNP